MDTIENTIIQLRSLAVENRNKADFFELAANLQEQGYISDTAIIQNEIQADIDARSARIDLLESTIATLVAEKEVVEAPIE